MTACQIVYEFRFVIAAAVVVAGLVAVFVAGLSAAERGEL